VSRSMARRFAPLAALLAALVVGGCAYGTAARLTPAQESARVAFIKAHGDYRDRDLARLCPGLYPRDFLTNKGDWPAGEARSGDRSSRAIATARTRAAAQIRAAGCDVFPSASSRPPRERDAPPPLRRAAPRLRRERPARPDRRRLLRDREGAAHARDRRVR